MSRAGHAGGCSVSFALPLTTFADLSGPERDRQSHANIPVVLYKQERCYWLCCLDSIVWSCCGRKSVGSQRECCRDNPPALHHGKRTSLSSAGAIAPSSGYWPPVFTWPLGRFDQFRRHTRSLHGKLDTADCLVRLTPESSSKLAATLFNSWLTKVLH